MSELLVVLGAIAGFVWTVIASLATAVFWLVVIVVVGFFAAIIFRPSLLERRPRRAVDHTDICVESIRLALKSGELDAEIARVNARNQRRNAA